IGVSVWNSNISATSLIGSGARVNAHGEVLVWADSRYPYEIQWLQIDGIGGLIDKLNTSGGIRAGFFNSWTQVEAQGKKGALATSFNFVFLNNAAVALIKEDALINQDFIFANTAIDVGNNTITLGYDHGMTTGDALIFNSGGGASLGLTDGTVYYAIATGDPTKIKLAASATLAAAGTALDLSAPASAFPHFGLMVVDGHRQVVVYASTIMETVHLAGVFALTFFGSKSGGTGIGGTLFFLDAKNTTLARIEGGAQVSGTALGVKADVRAFTVVIAMTTGKSDKWAINGTFSYAYIDNDTTAHIDDGAFITIAPDSTCSVYGAGVTNCLKIPRARKILARYSFFRFSGAYDTIELLPYVLDTNDDGEITTVDDHVIFHDAGATGSPEDDIFITDFGVLVSSEDESELYNVTGGITQGKSVGMGFTVGYNELNRNTNAIVGQPVFEPQQVDDNTIDLGYVHNFQSGDVVIYDNGGGTSLSTTGGTLTSGSPYYVIRKSATEIQITDSYAHATADTPVVGVVNTGNASGLHSFRKQGETLQSGLIVSSGEFQVIGENVGTIGAGSIAAAVITDSSTQAEGAQAPEGGGSYGIGVSGAASVNISHQNLAAYISYANINHTGNLDVRALTDTMIVGVVGAITVNTSKEGSNAGGIAGSFGWNDITSKTQAFINHSNINISGGSLNLKATNDDLIVGIAVSFSIV
ncbi:MAG: hypothetical protein H8D34_25775, partial [Chloroflexi bacterium]|nr:hypothetical protein [Chloroflexota bacterium]